MRGVIERLLPRQFRPQANIFGFTGKAGGFAGKAGGFTGRQGRLCNSMIGFIGKAYGFTSSKRHLRNSMIGSLGIKHRLLLFRYRQESICGWVPQTEPLVMHQQA